MISSEAQALSFVEQADIAERALVCRWAAGLSGTVVSCGQQLPSSAPGVHHGEQHAIRAIMLP